MTKKADKILVHMNGKEVLSADWDKKEGWWDLSYDSTYLPDISEAFLGLLERTQEKGE